MTHIPGRMAWEAKGPVEKLSMVYNLKPPDIVYFWNSPFNTLGLWLATDSQNLGKQNTQIRETTVFVDYLNSFLPL